LIELLKASLKVGGGLSALGAGLFYFVHIELIKSELFSKLTPEQAFHYCLYSLGLAAICAITLFFVHSKKDSSKGTHATNSSIAVNNTGDNSSITIGSTGNSDGSKQ
jgi:hypothetical protein